MTQSEREQEVRKKLYSYAQYAQDLKDFEDNILYGAKQFDISGVHGSGISDPSAKKGIALADMSPYMKQKQQWINAIDDGLKELDKMDKGNAHGYRYICTRMYGIPSQRIKQGTVRISIECNLSRSSIYTKLQTITNVMMFHATAKGLL